jgi:hypothetical protein
VASYLLRRMGRAPSTLYLSTEDDPLPRRSPGSPGPSSPTAQWAAFAKSAPAVEGDSSSKRRRKSAKAFHDMGKARTQIVYNEMVRGQG